MSRSKVGLALIGLVSGLIIFYAATFAVGSLYKIGLENEFKIYSNYLDVTQGNNEDTVAAKRHSLLERVNLLTNKMLEWNEYDPEHLSFATYTELLNSYANENIDSYDLFLEKSLFFSNKAIALRPIYPDAHAQNVYVLSGLKRPLDDVIKQLHVAERVGPYEKATARAGLDFYTSLWDRISIEDKIKVSRYALEPEKYGFRHKEFNSLIAKANYKVRICNLLKYSGNVLEACSQ